MPAWSDGIEAVERRGDRLGHVGDRPEHALAAEPRRVAVAQLDRLVGTGRGAGRHRRPTDRAVGQDDVDLDGRVAARIEDLAGVDASMKVLTRGPSLSASPTGSPCRCLRRRRGSPSGRVVAFGAWSLRCRGVAFAGPSRRRRLLRCRLRLGLLGLDRAIEQDRHAGQLAALEELERRAAAGRDVGHPVGQALLGDRRDRVAATDDDRRAGVGALGQHPRDRLRPVGERRDLEDAQRPVPEHGLDVGERLDHQVLARLAEVDDVPRGGDLLGLERLVLGAAGDLLGHDDVDRQDDPDVVLVPPWRGSAGRPRPGRARRGSCRSPCPARAGRCSPSRHRGRACRPWTAGGR